MKSLFLRLRDRCFSHLAKKEDIHHLYNQIAGLLQVQNAMRGEPVLRPMRGWAISPDAMTWILAELQEHARPTVIEFGSGQSTIILAAVLKRIQGKLISVEHDREYSLAIQRQAIACHVADVIEHVHSPLVKVSAQCQSYDVSVLPTHPIDMALIDGPPEEYGRLTRLTPLRWAVAQLTKDASIFLDDFSRIYERECLEQLKETYPDLICSEKAAEKGLLQLRRA